MVMERFDQFQKLQLFTEQSYLDGTNYPGTTTAFSKAHRRRLTRTGYTGKLTSPNTLLLSKPGWMVQTQCQRIRSPGIG